MASAQASTVSAEWFLARDGQQFGPLSDAELRKLVEFGHLKPTDLLWREGFPDWRSAHILLPDATSSAPPSAPDTEPVGSPAPLDSGPSLASTTSGMTPVDPVPVDPVPAAAPAAPASVVTPRVEAPGPMGPPPGQHRAPTAHRPMTIPAPTAGIRLATPRPLQGERGGPSAGPSQAASQPRLNEPLRGPAPQPTQAPHASFARSRPADQGHGLPPGPSTAGAPGPDTRPMPGPSSAALAQAAPPAGDRRARGAAPVDRGQAKGIREGQAGLWVKRAAIVTFFMITLGAAGFAAYPYRDAATTWLVKATASVQPPTVSPLTGYSPSVETTDSAFQQAPFWRLTKKEFPDWYEARVREASVAARENKPAPETHKQLLQAVLELRRKHAGDALSATPPRLVTLASAFADALVQLRQVGVDACYGFIIGGEVSPGYMSVLADAAQNRPFQAQLVAMFEAVADGRQTPRVYPQPRQADYNQLVVLLEARGWTERDMALFSNSQAFGQAAPEKVCRMVTDWFQAQLDIKDKDAQLRLLADSLRPVVAG